MGSLAIAHIAVSRAPLGPESTPLTAVIDNVGGHIPDDATAVGFTFQLVEGAGTAELERYVNARAAALAKHGGEVLVSGCTERNASWKYDTFEVIAFANGNGLRDIMGDPEYRDSPEVQQSQQIFQGDSAVVTLSIARP
jgi:uncharacterized protein (DUF1330 family)